MMKKEKNVTKELVAVNEKVDTVVPSSNDLVRMTKTVG